MTGQTGQLSSDFFLHAEKTRNKIRIENKKRKKIFKTFMNDEFMINLSRNNQYSGKLPFVLSGSASGYHLPMHLRRSETCPRSANPFPGFLSGPRDIESPVWMWQFPRPVSSRFFFLSHNNNRGSLRALPV